MEHDEVEAEEGDEDDERHPPLRAAPVGGGGFAVEDWGLGTED